ncbi:MAG: AAA family ATPase [Bacteroidia bacterium]|nr:AAA family ATPase [Bacteroidia bacterium]
MIKSIVINNFRCFEKACFKGFKQINLIGGLNNAGKTAFLEAVYLYKGYNFKSSHLANLYKFRHINQDKLRPILERQFYNDLFWQQNNELTISFEESFDDDTASLRLSLSLDKDGFITVDSTENRLKNIISTVFLPTDYKLSSIDIVKAYDEIEMKGEEEILLQAFRVIDPEIEKVRSFASNPISLYIRKKGGNFLPINFWGDALNKMAFYILHIIQNKGGILLIDEIENGIHYTHHFEFWKSLITLCIKYDVQLFATSHSLEMIKAYNEVAKETQNEEICNYFEMIRHVKTGEITANVMTMDMLEYEIAKNQPFRGE